METPEAGGPVPTEENTVPDAVADPGERAGELVEWQTNLPDVDPGDDGSAASAVPPVDVTPDEQPPYVEPSPAEVDAADEAAADEEPAEESAAVEGADAAEDSAVAEEAVAADDSAVDASEQPAESEPPTAAPAEETAAESPDEVSDAESMVLPAPGPKRSWVPWWPYLAYIALWIGLAAGLAYVGIQAGTPFLNDSVAYPYLVLGGLLMTLLGPVLGVVGWLAARGRTAQGERQGLFVAALLRASLFTVAGVALFWGALVLVDALRLGWL